MDRYERYPLIKHPDEASHLPRPARRTRAGRRAATGTDRGRATLLAATIHAAYRHRAIAPAPRLQSLHASPVEFRRIRRAGCCRCGSCRRASSARAGCDVKAPAIYPPRHQLPRTDGHRYDYRHSTSLRTGACPKPLPNPHPYLSLHRCLRLSLSLGLASP